MTIKNVMAVFVLGSASLVTADAQKVDRAGGVAFERAPATASQTPDGAVHNLSNRRLDDAANNPTDVSISRGIRRAEQQPVVNGFDSEFRTYQGHNNNLSVPGMGVAGSDLARWTTVAYADNLSEPSMEGRPSARHVSNVVFDQPYSKPNALNASDYLWQWGQFLDHDIDLTDGTDPPEPMPIAVPEGDVYFDPDATGTAQIPFNRSIYNHDTGSDTGSPRMQINEISAWIDASNVYGSDDVRAAELREFDGSGMLKTSPGNLLPFNVNGLPNAGGSGANLYLAGDVRANEQLGLTTMHTLFVREHNRLAQQIAIENPSLDDEHIYQRARSLVGGIMQYITYNEFLPLLLGADALSPYAGYDPGRTADISNEFSTAAYRFGHSALSPTLRRVLSDGATHPGGHLELRDAFFAPTLLAETDTFEAVLRGLASQVCQAIDATVIDDVRNFLFGPPGAGGLDLVALNVQRGRDHGLGSYVSIREEMGLAPITTFEQISSDPDVRQRLASAYSAVADIDVWVGGLAEDPVPGAMVGELYFAMIKKQFEALRDGDRFWYQHSLNADDIALVEASTLAAVIRRNTAIDVELSDNVFIVSDLPDTDLDGVEDVRDNCLNRSNPTQFDADSDGFGNACDADFNNDGVTNFIDLSAFADHFLSSNDVYDLNVDGVVNNLDLVLFRDLFLAPAGPSGLHQW